MRNVTVAFAVDSIEVPKFDHKITEERIYGLPIYTYFTNDREEAKYLLSRGGLLVPSVTHEFRIVFYLRKAVQ